MDKSDPRLLEIAASVADGRPVDWQALLAETPAGDLRESFRALEALGRLKAVHASTSQTAALTPGARLGRYEIVEPIGAGGMGEVYRARDTHLPREVAIKVLRLGSQGSAVLRKRLEREARVAARLSHPRTFAHCTTSDAKVRSTFW